MFTPRKTRFLIKPVYFVFTLFALVCSWSLTLVVANVCPFCSAINLTFAEQLDSNDIVVVAKLLEVPPPSDDPNADFPKAEFEILQVLKGKDLVAPEMKFRTQLVGSYPIGQKFLVMGVDPPKIAWTTPMKASDRVFKYLTDIQSLPAGGAKRLEFFQNYFEDQESILAFDAYDEFAKAPYADLIALKDQMQRDRLVAWILDPDTSVNRRRLYFTMLGVCGTDADIKMMEDLIRSGDRKKMAGLDALIASYLTLKGEAGVDLIETTFLADPESDYVDANAAVSALRFQGTELDLIPKERIVRAVRHLLDRPKMADMIIPDLARWEDWSVMERLVQMFKDADEESNWLRVPVITYLRACPKPEAKAYIAELSKIDPDAVKRADFFLGGFGDDEVDDEENSAVDDGNQGTGNEDGTSEDDNSGNEAEQQPAAGSDGTTMLLIDKDEFFVSEVSRDHVVLKVPVDSVNSVDRVISAGPKISQNLIELNSKVDQTTKTEIEIPVSAKKTETKLAPLANRPGPSLVSKASTNPAAIVPQGEAGPPMIETTPVAAVTSANVTWLIVFVPMGVSLVIFLLLWSVVNGWFERLIF